MQRLPRVKAPAGAPHILLVMTDDVGFSAASTFGGPIPTPNLDRLASQGLKYNQFHTTGICSPTRAALLTGRNHHAVGMATVVELGTPYPGYNGIIPKSAATVARVLRENGYSTAMFGKHHNVPNEENSPAGPFDHWPTGLGFEYFYGFVAGDTHQWQPALVEGITPLDSARRNPGELLDKELADRAIHWIHNQQAAAPDKPFFIYYAPGTAHAPHQAPKDWIAKFRGKFDQGWDELRVQILARQKVLGIVPRNTQLSARPSQIPAWNSLSSETRRVYARYMEVYAAMLAYQDAQFGRLLDELQRMGIADNTLILFVEGDNGGSGESGGLHGTTNELNRVTMVSNDDSETKWLASNLDVLGSADTYEGYPVGWSFATGTPFPWVKQVASHLGGVRNGLVISWPSRIRMQGELRTQYHHVIDVVPTLLEAAHVKAPASVDGVTQLRMDGTSMIYSFDTPDAPSTRRTQYYEIHGNRGIYHDGWLASTTPRNMPWDFYENRPTSDVTTYNWELYDLRNDFGQAHDVAAKHPQRLQQMQALFDTEARRNHVYPIQDSGAPPRHMQSIRAAGQLPRTRYIYWGSGIRMTYATMPPIFNLPFTIDADLEIPAAGANGVIVAAGSQFGGLSFYLQEGRPVAYLAATQLPGDQSRIAAETAIPAGPAHVRFEYVPATSGDVMVISVNGKEVARGNIARRARSMAGLGETFDTGRDTNVPVTKDYVDGGEFTGTINKVEVNITGPAT